jgi:hypothetical protein
MHNSIVVVAFAALLAPQSLPLPDLGSSARSHELELKPRPLPVLPYVPERAVPGPQPYWETDPLYVGPRHQGMR